MAVHGKQQPRKQKDAQYYLNKAKKSLSFHEPDVDDLMQNQYGDEIWKKPQLSPKNDEAVPKMSSN
jgi:hypothetical protein